MAVVWCACESPQLLHRVTSVLVNLCATQGAPNCPADGTGPDQSVDAFVIPTTPHQPPPLSARLGLKLEGFWVGVFFLRRIPEQGVSSDN